MKKVLSLIIMFALVFSFVGCDANNANGDTSSGTSNYTIDYFDAESFESALNNGTKVNGKIVQFYANDYVPDSILGINCHAGEHLNFISEVELDAAAGDTITVRVTKEPSKTLILGSWKIPCEVLKIEKNMKEAETVGNETVGNETEASVTQTPRIIVTMSEDEFIGMHMADAEELLKDMGFTVFEHFTMSTDESSDLDGKIWAVEIISRDSNDGNFSVGDTYDTDAKVWLWSYKYIETESETTLPATVEPSSSVEPSTSSADMVWIPQSGSKYHRKSSCSGMKNPSQVTKEKAIRLGYTPCSRCY